MKQEKGCKEAPPAGPVTRQEVKRRLAELAFGRVNDCVRLVMEEGVSPGGLDLSLLSEIRRTEKGAVEIKLIDRLKVLEQLTALTEEETSGAEAFLEALRGEQK